MYHLKVKISMGWGAEILNEIAKVGLIKKAQLRPERQEGASQAPI